MNCFHALLFTLNRCKKFAAVFLLIISLLIVKVSSSQTISRGPYLQMGNVTSITIRWRTSVATNSKVTIGTVFGTYPTVFTNATSLVDHEMSITGLTADTKYYYTVGSTTLMIEGTVNNYFNTLPLATSTHKVRILAFGDCGNNSANQANVRDAFLNYASVKNINPDAWLLLGDNAYNGGFDGEYTTGFFNYYSGSMLKNIKLYPCPGNHDYDNQPANLQKRGVNLPYYNMFTLPALGEIGGVASNTEAFYSYNVGNVHIISLDSYGTENGAANTHLYDVAVGNAQADWLRSDLAANTRKWTVVYFHHPPQTKGSHDSDVDADLKLIHNNVPAILEQYGVDLVINGHSHVYERSFLMKNLYGLSTTYTAGTNLVDGSSAKYNGLANTCPYTYPSGQSKHGTVYIVAGSSGQVGGSNPGWPLAFNATSNNANGGSFYFEVDSNRLDAKFISYTTGPLAYFERDQFTIFKDVNKTQNITVVQNTPSTLTASWRGSYIWPSNGSVTTQAVTVNNAIAGTFTYTVKDANTCIQDVFNITVTATVPVLTTNFSAVLNKDIVLLNWSTSQEANNKHFTIERSTDGNSFSFLGRVNGAGTTSFPQNYSMKDLHPVQGLNYYRLSQTDLDASTKNIEVKKVSYHGSSEFALSWVNAGTGIVNLAIYNPGAGMIQLKVLDIMGREVQAKTISSATGNVYQSLQLQKGTYILVLVNQKGEMIRSKIVAD